MGGVNMELLRKELEEFGEEFGEVLPPVKFLKGRSEPMCHVFLQLHKMAVGDGAISKKTKFLIHAAITAAAHDVGATVMHLTGAMRAGATDEELFETAATLIPVAGMPTFGIFLEAWQKAAKK
jgi:alkylhydroperoxidase/carboxymuconolactone decarboxylase family protein YurZ